ncbi:2'-5' RNA ligase family protein [Gracilimonas mengyeensis]|uniref:2'-5' RNA ligase n=1 Tax=Gracilimonas mengyeensis TaxID=1302730 RepID=A0A521DGK8_9BACT|nr:2'-5' RNA ligase family protein [Gracilimonas mengyeensis]SMO70857.1 2'-5' RNA ligase [Gracilimonas mengyeensis]
MSSNFNKPLFFVGVIPDETLQNKIQELKHYVKDTYHSSHSLNAPPHITLLSPFRTDADHTQELHLLLEVFAQAYEPFEVSLDGFATFPPRVIFIDVDKSEPLMTLQEKLEELARSKEELFSYGYKERPYHPHMTLAFKDLTKANFHRAWKEFKDREFDESFKVDKLSLLKHDGERWEVEKEFELGK